MTSHHPLCLVILFCSVGPDVDDLLLSQHGWDGSTFLHKAAEYRSAKTVKLLLDLLPPHIIDKLFVMRDELGRTLLRGAAVNKRDDGVLLDMIKYYTSSADRLGELHIELKYPSTHTVISTVCI